MPDLSQPQIALLCVLFLRCCSICSFSQLIFDRTCCRSRCCVLYVVTLSYSAFLSPINGTHNKSKATYVSLLCFVDKSVAVSIVAVGIDIDIVVLVLVLVLVARCC